MSGTWKPNYNHVVKAKEYVVWFYRLYEETWGYMDMADYPSEIATDKFMVKVLKWRTDWRGRQVADCLSEELKTYGDKDFMNMLWWNFTNRPPSYEAVKRYFEGRENA